MRTIGACVAACLFDWSPALAQISFQGKTVTMIIGFAAGGGTDAYRGTNEVMLALERGEIETSTANLFLIRKLVASARLPKPSITPRRCFANRDCRRNEE